MITPIFYTIAQLRPDLMPELLAVTHESARRISGTNPDNERWDVLPSKCIGRFLVKGDAVRALRRARTIFAGHATSVHSARRALSEAQLARANALRAHIARQPGQYARVIRARVDHR